MGKRLVTAVLGLALLSTASVWAQGLYPLEYRQVTDPADPCAACARRYVQGPRTGADSARGDGDTGTAYYSVRVGSGELPIALNASGVFVDTNGDGSLQGEDGLPLWRRESNGSYAVYRLGPVRAQVPGAAQGTIASFFVEVTRPQAGPAYVVLYPAGYWSGQALLGGRTRRIALVDGDYDGRYDRVFAPSADPSSCDCLAMDLDGDGMLRPDDPRTLPEVMPLPRMIQVGGACYSVEAAPDGSAIRFTTVQPSLGTLDVGFPGADLVLLSDCGPFHLSGQNGRWTLPEGGYQVQRLTLNQADGRGNTWTLRGAGDMGRLSTFSIQAGQVLPLKVGPPLTIRTTAQPAGAGVVLIGCIVAGQAGEEYVPGVAKDGRAQPAPKFRIVDERGNVGEQGSFEYG